MHSNYVYLDVNLEFGSNITQEEVDVLPVFFKASIEQSLQQVFGEIGGLTTLDLIKFDPERFRGIFRLPKTDYVKVRAAITLVSSFQGKPCRFNVTCASPELGSLIRTDFNY